jgi:hypothetical protein
VIIVVDPAQAEADLACGRLNCPHCDGRLTRWAHGRLRRVRMLDGSTRQLEPRRARCRSCRRTQVLLPGWCSPRRGDATEVIGAALLARARGLGWRCVAAELDRPASTVRRWLRSASGAPGAAASTRPRVRGDARPGGAVPPSPSRIGHR